MIADKPILVTGGTGKQGGAVLKHLLEQGAPARALTRDPASPKAVALASQGVEVVQGNLDDPESITRALEGVRAVFAVQDPWSHGVPAEIRQGKMLGDLAKAAGVQRFVQASVAAANVSTNLPHFESKGTIERHLQSLGLDVTAVRPVLFMESLLERFEPKAVYILELLRRGLRGKSVQLISVDDIGRVAAEALLENRTDRPGLRGIELAGDELNFNQIVETYARVVSRRPKVAYLPMIVIFLLGRKPYSSYRWMGARGWHYDLASLRAERPWLSTFEMWLRANTGN
ncbi:NmrA/HSCARG family protein [Mesorhizobium sp. M4B.F.Ca.ET.169.01.1.1]|uniref:NmrA/HSCARG family protein n=1 Tax=unclassified Mesorhizobium TaxID=325217 RepID=UPI000FCC4461|nr:MULTISPECIES: NmrA/HSCARG family protein [unclassified Mesorhizobium]RVD46082.1 NmrA/HSCARG family protein [Mesorhizobium sp. M4B.F.Ca.ET.019.03.1.1]TGT41904.1 NmrA/HSCARG family protein [Mesorhizobium sp. M4B.F.Ca.ET.169.01.1.1]